MKSYRAFGVLKMRRKSLENIIRGFLIWIGAKADTPHFVLVQHFSSCKLYRDTAVSLNPLLVQTMTSSSKNTLRHPFRDPHSSTLLSPRFIGVYRGRSPPRRLVYWWRSHRCLFFIRLWHLCLWPPPLKGAPRLKMRRA